MLQLSGLCQHFKSHSIQFRRVLTQAVSASECICLGHIQPPYGADYAERPDGPSISNED